ncbi:MAG TPA: 50S ribosomal protein L11 methyltransferase [Desulfomicrobiaceae bacterium]|nr:50S ribosomal protein L11 methyltransferase [Desulfomicrobiaceae bacterium]
MHNTLTRITIIFPEAMADAMAPLFCRYAPWGWEEQPGPQEEHATAVLHFDRPEQAQDFLADLGAGYPEAAVVRDEVENADWSEAWREFFQPIRVRDRFMVLPTWLSEEHQGLTPLLIEPKMAFGTGHHTTTRLCLETLVDLVADGRIGKETEFLDLGTGSGILGIGAVHLGLRGRGLDIDPVAIDNARENIALNGIENAFHVATGGIDSLPADQTFDCIVANILANPLIEMAPSVVAALRPGAVLILSGILGEQAGKVAAAYQNLGLKAPAISHDNEWSVLVWA